ncbi:unnamed protein product [Alopecurus aequalis]
MLSDAAFAREYRQIHGAPPMLGFLYEELDVPVNLPFPEKEDYHWAPHFVSTATYRPPTACRDRRYWHVLDSRHGRVLFYTPRRKTATFVVCDLVIGKRWEVDANPKYDGILRWYWDDEERWLQLARCNAAVFCAKDRCDHLDCHGAPFRIALVGSDDVGSIASATVYSSGTGQWSGMIEVQTPCYIYGTDRQSALVGNKVYVPCVDSDSIVEYNMDEQKLTLIDVPDTNHPEYIRLMGVEDDMLLFASVKKPTLYLWSMDVGPGGAQGWARHRTIDLEPSLTLAVLSNCGGVLAVGFAEGVNVIFLGTYNGLYPLDLNSGQGKKVQVHTRRWIERAIPYMSYYTGGFGATAI